MFVGVVTLGIGAALTAFPEKAAALVGLEGEASTVRAIGVADLTLVPGLLFASRKSRWMTARAGYNVVMAAYLKQVAPRAKNPALINATAGTLGVLTVIDGATAVALKKGEAA